MTAQQNPATDQFFHTTYTQADARRRITLLEGVLEQAIYAKGSGKTVDMLVNELGKTPEDRDAVGKFLRSSVIPNDPTSIKDFLAMLRDAILKRPVVNLSLPFEPAPDQIVAYGEWFRSNVDPNVLISVLFDASVVGGCSITWQGKQVTYDLEYLIRQKRTEVVKVVDEWVEKKKKERVI